MSEKPIRLISRKSLLALWQANYVKQKILALHPNETIQIIGINTEADKILTLPLTKLGGKGLFVKELEEALLRNEADIAVHSMKDVPTELPTGLKITAILKRADPREAFLSHQASSIFNLPLKATLGTSSLRRQAQVLRLRPDLIVKPLRGNVDTRLKKLDQGEFDAIILAVCGLERLGFKNRITAIFEPDEILPSIGQGALGIECREEDFRILRLITALNDRKTQACLTAERALNASLGGNCHTPIAGLASVSVNNKLSLQALVASPKGDKILLAKHEGTLKFAHQLGQTVAEALKLMNAQQLISMTDEHINHQT